MADHKSFLAALPEETRRALTERNDAPGLIRLAGHFGLILGVGGLIAAEAPGWPVLIPVQGVLIVFLFTLQHECTHKTPFRTEWVNEWTGRIAGLLIVQPFEWFRYYHLAHHRFTGDPDRDPELAGGPPRGWLAFLIGLSGWTYWRHNISVLLACAAGRAGVHTPDRAAPRIVREARLMILAYLAAMLAMATVAPLLFWVWVVPVIVGMPALRIYLLAEHGRCPMVADMFDNTRTTYTNAIVRFIAWNMPWHTEHHVSPSVPFHRLPALADLTATHLRHTEDGYARFAVGYAAEIGNEPERTR